MVVLHVSLFGFRSLLQFGLRHYLVEKNNKIIFCRLDLIHTYGTDVIIILCA